MIKLNWNSIFNIQEGNPQLQKILDAYKDVFGEELGTLKGTEAKISVALSAPPKFMKARPVPYALKAKVEKELDRLQSESIISPVEFTEWAAPIVPVDQCVFVVTTTALLTKSQSWIIIQSPRLRACLPH